MRMYLNRNFKKILLLLVLVTGVLGGLTQSIVEGQVVSGVVSYTDTEQNIDQQFTSSSSTSVTYTEKTAGLVFKVPDYFSVDGYTNVNPQSYVINWNKNIMLTKGENISISVWNRMDKRTMKSVYSQIISMDGCPNYILGNVCTVNFPADPKETSAYIKYFLYEKSLVRVMYSFSHLYEVENFKTIANSISIKSTKLFAQKDYTFLDKNAQTRESMIMMRGADTCGGLTDTNNPYDCCSSSEEGQNDANCTWYAAYKRPDLKGVITLYPGGLFNQAQQAGVPTSYNQPVAGSLIVWELHVAYVESVGTDSVTWSEQNCYSTNNAFNASVTRSSYTPNYAAGTFLGYILPSGSTNSCSGSNPIMTNWNTSGPLSCTPVSSLTIVPESRLQSINGDINIKPN
jgi:surface antigen